MTDREAFEAWARELGFTDLRSNFAGMEGTLFLQDRTTMFAPETAATRWADLTDYGLYRNRNQGRSA
jgi:hypothetical protein